jgi:amidase
VRAVIRNAARSLGAACARVDEDRPDCLQETTQLYGRYFGTDGGAWVRRLLARYGTTKPFPFLRWAEGLDDRPASSWTELLAQVGVVKADMLRFMRRYDVLICPAHPEAALPSDVLMAEPRRAAFSYTQTYNLTGWPAGVVRGGSTSEGLPVGVQVVARPWREDLVLAVMRCIEVSGGGWQMPALAAR